MLNPSFVILSDSEGSDSAQGKLREESQAVIGVGPDIYLPFDENIICHP